MALKKESRSHTGNLFSTCRHFEVCCRVWIKIHVLLLCVMTFRTSSVFFCKYGINLFFLSAVSRKGIFFGLGRTDLLKKMHYLAQWALIYFFVYLSHLFISIVSIYPWVRTAGNGKMWMTLGKRVSGQEEWDQEILTPVCSSLPVTLCDKSPAYWRSFLDVAALLFLLSCYVAVTGH